MNLMCSLQLWPYRFNVNKINMDTHDGKAIPSYIRTCTDCTMYNRNACFRVVTAWLETGKDSHTFNSAYVFLMCVFVRTRLMSCCVCVGAANIEWIGKLAAIGDEEKRREVQGCTRI